MYYIKKELSEFSAAHRIINGYKGECQNLHGHNYQTTVIFATSTLNTYGMVIDFSVIKAICSAWLKEHWDHSVIINHQDLKLLEFVTTQQQKHYIMEGINTTAECMAAYLYKKFQQLMDEQYNQHTNNPLICVVSVEVFESRFASAIYAPDGNEVR